MSVPRALLLVLALLQALGITEHVRRTACEAECREDGCDDDCAPGTESACVCHCPTAPSATAPAITVATLPPIAVVPARGVAHATEFPSSPDPREIWHVPRPSSG